MDTKTRSTPRAWLLFAPGLLAVTAAQWTAVCRGRGSAVMLFWVISGIALWLLLRLHAGHRPKAGRFLWLLAAMALGLGPIAAACTAFLIVRESRRRPEVKFDYLVVLGCTVHGSMPSRSLRDRIDAAYTYLRAHESVTCIVSGGKGNAKRLSEAVCMYNALTGLGIGENRVWMEDKAVSTQENFALSLALIAEKTGTRPDRIGFLSSDYHLFRANMFARAQGITACGIPAKTGSLSLYLNYLLREIVMVWYYAVTLR